MAQTLFKVFGNSASNKKNNNEDDTDVPSIPVQVIDVGDELHKINNCEVPLPNHYRCYAHTLNLLTTSDVMPRW